MARLVSSRAIVSLAAQTAILGLGYFNPHIELLGDQVAMARHQGEQMQRLASQFPTIMGLSFFLAPFTYGLAASPAALAYRALTQKAPPA